MKIIAIVPRPARRRVRAAGLCLLLALCLGACARSVPAPHHQPACTTYTLANGIRVFVQPAPHRRTCSIVCALAGAKQLLPPDRAGLDSATLRLMAMQSQHYSDVARRALLKRTSAKITAAEGLDWCTYSLKTIDTYFDETFALYGDLLCNPVFPEALFEEVITSMRNQHRSELADGFSRVSRAVNRTFFANHPYHAHLDTAASLQRITLEDVRSFYTRLVQAERITVFAVGNFETTALREKFEATLGTLPRGNTQPVPVPPLVKPAGPVLLLDSYDGLRPDVAYVRGNLPALPVTHTDYWALALATHMLTDGMANLVRTRNGLVYSAWAHLFARQANYATIALYRTGDPAAAVHLVRRSIETLAGGRCLSPVPDETTGDGYVPIAEALDVYTRAVATDFYSSLQTTDSIALQMAASFALTGDPLDYLQVMNRVAAVTPGQIARVAAGCLQQGPITWAVSAHPETAAALRADPHAFAPAAAAVTLQ